MNHRLVFYPTWYKPSVIHPCTTGGGKANTLTAFYHTGLGGYDLRPQILELYEHG